VQLVKLLQGLFISLAIVACDSCFPLQPLLLKRKERKILAKQQIYQPDITIYQDEKPAVRKIKIIRSGVLLPLVK